MLSKVLLHSPSLKDALVSWDPSAGPELFGNRRFRTVVNDVKAGTRVDADSRLEVQVSVGPLEWATIDPGRASLIPDC